MKQNVSQKVISFIIKYLWILCLALVVVEISATLISVGILVKQNSQAVIRSVGGEISGRVDGVLRLLTGLSKDDRFADTSTSLQERAVLARPYKESFNLFMVALTDENVNVASTNTKPGAKLSNLAHRDYMQAMYSTGEYQITDAFPAGADGVTWNYTIAVPILKDNITKGCVFGSIYFDDIKEILKRNTSPNANHSYLLGADTSFMASGDDETFDKDKLAADWSTGYIGTSSEKVNDSWQSGSPANFWKMTGGKLYYVTSMRVVPSKWTLVYQVEFFSALPSMMPILWGKVFLYLLLCTMVSLFGRKYLRRQLAETTHLWDRVTAMQKQLFQSEQLNYDEIFDLSAQGLTDQLTGLATRSVLFSKMSQYFSDTSSLCSVFFLDLDDLKRINDNFGHEAGDCALIHFSTILKQYEQKYNGIASRYGGDEFIFICCGMTEEQVGVVASELCAELRTTINISTHEFIISGSIGVAMYPEDGETVEELICKADMALYIAKRKGKNGFAFYDSETGPTL